MPKGSHVEPEDIPAKVDGQITAVDRWLVVMLIAAAIFLLVIILRFSPPVSRFTLLLTIFFDLAAAIFLVAMIGLLVAVFRLTIPPAIDYLRHRHEEVTDPDEPTLRLPLFWAVALSIALPVAWALAYWGFPHQRPLLGVIYVVVGALAIGWSWLRRRLLSNSARGHRQSRVRSSKSEAE